MFSVYMKILVLSLSLVVLVMMFGCFLGLQDFLAHLLEEYLSVQSLQYGPSSASHRRAQGQDDSLTSSDDVFTEALITIGIVVAVLMGLICLRFGCNILIDVFVLQQYEWARSLAEFWRRLCPWWHRRTQPAEGATTGVSASDERLPRESARSALQTVPLEQRCRLVETIVPSRVLTPDDFKRKQVSVNNDADETARVDEEHGEGDIESASRASDGAIVCCICLHELQEGDSVLDLINCEHLFHKSCVAEWINSNGTDCPYCRKELIRHSDLVRCAEDQP